MSCKKRWFSLEKRRAKPEQKLLKFSAICATVLHVVRSGSQPDGRTTCC